MEITIRSAQVTALDVEIDSFIRLQDIRLTGGSIQITTEPTVKVTVGEAAATLTVTESALNKVLAGVPDDKVRDLDLKTFNGRVSISGRHSLMGPVSIPFTLSAVPEIEAGRRLRLAPQKLEVAGAFGVPQFLVQTIGAKVNAQLAERFDAANLPVPLRLTGVTVEPGRLVLSAALEVVTALPAPPPSPESGPSPERVPPAVEPPPSR